MSLPRPVRLLDHPVAPNPRRVRIFLAEKGVEIPRETIDIMTGEQFHAHKARVGWHHVPAMELEDGRWLTESAAICRYIEALAPEPNLMGRDPLEDAQIEMWARRAEFEILGPIAAVLRHGNPKMAVMESPQCPAWAEANRPRVLAGLAWLDRRLGESRYLAGERITHADIVALVAVDFMRTIRTAVPEDHAHLLAWREGLHARPAFAS